MLASRNLIISLVSMYGRSIRIQRKEKVTHLSSFPFATDAPEYSREHAMESVYLIRTECGARSCLYAMVYFYTEIVGCQKNDEEPGTAMHLCLVL